MTVSAPSRARIVSSFTVIKGALLDETYAVFQAWDRDRSKQENLARVTTGELLGSESASWRRDLVKVLNRRYDPAGRDRPLVELAQAGVDPLVWRPLVLWHITRDEFLLRDFLLRWLQPRHADGTFRLRTADVVPYLEALHARRDVELAEAWTPATTSRVASGLLRMASDFGLLTGTQAREFASYHLPDESFLYLLHAFSEAEGNARRVVECEDWRLFLLDGDDVERELFRLHQLRRLRYQVAGTLSQLDLPCRSTRDYVKGLVG